MTHSNLRWGGFKPWACILKYWRRRRRKGHGDIRKKFWCALNWIQRYQVRSEEPTICQLQGEGGRPTKNYEIVPTISYICMSVSKIDQKSMHEKGKQGQNVFLYMLHICIDRCAHYTVALTPTKALNESKYISQTKLPQYRQGWCLEPLNLPRQSCYRQQNSTSHKRGFHQCLSQIQYYSFSGRHETQQRTPQSQLSSQHKSTQRTFL